MLTSTTARARFALLLFAFAAGCHDAASDEGGADPYETGTDAAPLSYVCGPGYACNGTGTIYASTYRIGVSPTSTGDLLQTFAVAEDGLLTGVSLPVRALRAVPNGAVQTLALEVLEVPGLDDPGTTLTPISTGSVTLASSTATSEVTLTPAVALDHTRTYAVRLSITLTGASSSLVGVGVWTAGTIPGSAWRSTARRLTPEGELRPSRLRSAGDFDLALGLAITTGGGSACAVPGFTLTATLATGAAPNGIAAGPFNGGGADLVVANTAGGDVSVLISNGDGTFQPAVNHAIGLPFGVTVGDFDGDGALDLAVPSYANDRLELLLGDGNGGFGAPSSWPTGSGSQPMKLVADDFDQDGHLDVATLNYGNATYSVSILLGNGDGTFQSFNQVPANASTWWSGIGSGDFDGDGAPDLALLEGGSVLRILINDGAGSFVAGGTFGAGSGLAGLGLGHFDADADLDIAIANASGQGALQVLLGTGTGTFGGASQIDGGPVPVAVRSADFNGDSKTDLAVADLGSDEVAILAGNGDGTFQTPVRFSIGAGRSPVDLAVADFNADGRADLATADNGGAGASVLLNEGCP